MSTSKIKDHHIALARASCFNRNSQDHQPPTVIIYCTVVRVVSRYSTNARQTLSKLYLDSGTLVWNGNSVTGAEAIQAFLEKLPSSEHTVICLDAQPVSSE